MNAKGQLTNSTLSIDEDEEELLKHGEGKFLNPHLKNLIILEDFKMPGEDPSRCLDIHIQHQHKKEKNV